MPTVALLAATGNFDEIAMHIRATAETGAGHADIAEALQHAAICAGVPRAQDREGHLRRVGGRGLVEPYLPRDPAAHPPALTLNYRSSVTGSPHLPLLSVAPSLREIVGPVFGQDMLADRDDDLIIDFTGLPAIGERVIDGNAWPVPGALLEIWQANARGRYRHASDGYLSTLDPNFGGFRPTRTGAITSTR